MVFGLLRKKSRIKSCASGTFLIPCSPPPYRSGLLANAVGQLQMSRPTHRIRQQAGSYNRSEIERRIVCSTKNAKSVSSSRALWFLCAIVQGTQNATWAQAEPSSSTPQITDLLRNSASQKTQKNPACRAIANRSPNTREVSLPSVLLHTRSKSRKALVEPCDAAFGGRLALLPRIHRMRRTGHV